MVLQRHSGCDVYRWHHYIWCYSGCDVCRWHHYIWHYSGTVAVMCVGGITVSGITGAQWL